MTGEGGKSRLNQVLLMCLPPAAEGSQETPPMYTEGGDAEEGDVPWVWDVLGSPKPRLRFLMDNLPEENEVDSSPEEHLSEDAPTWHLDYLHPSLR